MCPNVALAGTIALSGGDAGIFFDRLSMTAAYLISDTTGSHWNVYFINFLLGDGGVVPWWGTPISVASRVTMNDGAVLAFTRINATAAANPATDREFASGIFTAWPTVLILDTASFLTVSEWTVPLMGPGAFGIVVRLEGLIASYIQQRSQLTVAGIALAIARYHSWTGIVQIGMDSGSYLTQLHVRDGSTILLTNITHFTTTSVHTAATVRLCLDELHVRAGSQVVIANVFHSFPSTYSAPYCFLDTGGMKRSYHDRSALLIDNATTISSAQKVLPFLIQVPRGGYLNISDASAYVFNRINITAASYILECIGILITLDRLSTFTLRDASLFAVTHSRLITSSGFSSVYSVVVTCSPSQCAASMLNRSTVLVSDVLVNAAGAAASVLAFTFDDTPTNMFAMDNSAIIIERSTCEFTSAWLSHGIPYLLTIGAPNVKITNGSAVVVSAINVVFNTGLPAAVMYLGDGDPTTADAVWDASCRIIVADVNVTQKTDSIANPPLRIVSGIGNGSIPIEPLRVAMRCVRMNGVEATSLEAAGLTSSGATPNGVLLQPIALCNASTRTGYCSVTVDCAGALVDAASTATVVPDTLPYTAARFPYAPRNTPCECIVNACAASAAAGAVMEVTQGCFLRPRDAAWFAIPNSDETPPAHTPSISLTLSLSQLEASATAAPEVTSTVSASRSLKVPSLVHTPTAGRQGSATASMTATSPHPATGRALKTSMTVSHAITAPPRVTVPADVVTVLARASSAVPPAATTVAAVLAALLLPSSATKPMATTRIARAYDLCTASGSIGAAADASDDVAAGDWPSDYAVVTARWPLSRNTMPSDTAARAYGAAVSTSAFVAVVVGLYALYALRHFRPADSTSADQVPSAPRRSLRNLLAATAAVVVPSFLMPSAVEAGLFVIAVLANSGEARSRPSSSCA
jgi:hypothetical protein